MRVELPSGSSAWLTYCMNVHPGGTLASTRSAIRGTVLPLRDRLGIRGPFALGLRFDASATEALARDPDACRRFAAELAEADLAPITANAFVLGRFHGGRVKEAVYAPTWEDPARVRYTLETAEVLLRLSPAEIGLTISTAPGSWRTWVRGREAEAEGLCAANIAETARGLRALAEETGRHVALGLEPEPGCTIQTVEEAIRFFSGPLRDALGDDDELESHVGLCYDVCHQAVVHEDVSQGLARLREAGVPVVKMQASVALEIADPNDATAREALLAFDEEVYLHQVGACDGDGDGTALHVAPDLSDALGDEAWDRRRPWRVHFHVPVHRELLAGGLRTTRAELDAALTVVSTWERPPHVEVETYTWEVLPQAERCDGLVAALTRELTYVRAGLEGSRG